MVGLNSLEEAVLDKLLEGDHPLLVALRAQARNGRLASRDYSGAGFFCAFWVPQEMALREVERDFHFGDVVASMDGLEHGAGFVIFVRRGKLDMLEGYTFGESWPESVRNLELTYEREPRNLNLPDMQG